MTTQIAFIIAQHGEGQAVSHKKKKKTSFTTLFDAHWRRVILDEAHVIRNHKTGVSIGACRLNAGQCSLGHPGGSDV